MEYSYHIWSGAPSCYLEMLDKLQKRLCRTVDPSLCASLDHLAHRRNVASSRLFYKYYFGSCLSELVQLVPLPYSRVRSTHYSDRFHDFCDTFLDVMRMSMSTVSFLSRLDWHSLSIECFPLTHDLNAFKSRINIHL